MIEEKVRVGIVGLGRSGWDIHAACLADHPAFEVVSVADPLAERRQEARERFDCVAHADPNGVIDDAQVELAVVATPSHTHRALAVDAVNAGRHVVVEKPMAHSVDELDEMISAADRAGRVLTCFQQRRLENVVTATQQIVDSGRLGRLVLIRCVRNRYFRRADWQTLQKFGGGELANFGAHFVDQILTLLGSGPIEVFADLQHTVGAGDAEDHIKLCLRNDAGVVADIEHSLSAAFPRQEWEVIGTRGSVWSAGNGSLTVRWVDAESLDDLVVDDGPVAGRRYGTDEVLAWNEETIDVSHDASAMARTYYDRLHSTLRGGEALLITPQSVRQQLEIVDTARHQRSRRLADQLFN